MEVNWNVEDASWLRKKADFSHIGINLALKLGLGIGGENRFCFCVYVDLNYHKSESKRIDRNYYKKEVVLFTRISSRILTKHKGKKQGRCTDKGQEELVVKCSI